MQDLAVDVDRAVFWQEHRKTLRTDSETCGAALTVHEHCNPQPALVPQQMVQQRRLAGPEESCHDLPENKTSWFVALGRRETTHRDGEPRSLH